MARRLKVFTVSFLLACLFCFSASAEFSATDSSNLSSIRSYVSSIDTDIGLVRNYLQTISNQFTMVEGVTSLLRDIRNYLNPSQTGFFANQLFSKIDYLTSLLGSTSDYKVDDRNAYFAFDSRYCTTAAGQSDSYPGMIYGVDNNCVFTPAANRPMAYWLEPGNYRLFVNTSANAVPYSFAFDSYPSSQPNSSLTINDFTVINSNAQNLNRYYADFSITSEDGLYFDYFLIYSGVPSFYGCAYLYLMEDSTGIVSDSLTPSIDSHGQQLDQGVSQMEDLENTAFDSLDTSIGSLDFSGSALGQVVSGFTFIRAVFSAVYGSSPYISVLINLSCMLGVLALFLRVQPRFSRWEREHRDRSS